jgi:hypothetical protein
MRVRKIKNKQKENELHIWHCQIYQNTRALHAFAVRVVDRAACLAATATAHRRPAARPGRPSATACSTTDDNTDGAESSFRIQIH